MYLTGATRSGVLQECETLIDLLKIPFFTTYMGKGNVNEGHPFFGGVYMGDLGKEDVSRAVNTAGCVLRIGNYPVSTLLEIRCTSKYSSQG